MKCPAWGTADFPIQAGTATPPGWRARDKYSRRRTHTRPVIRNNAHLPVVDSGSISCPLSPTDIMTTSLELPPLGGTRLDAFLDEVESCFGEDEDESSSAQSLATAAGMLHAQPCQAENLAQLGRLFNVWWRVGEHDRALQVLDDQQGALPESERQSAELRLLFWRLNALHSLGTDSRFVSTLHQTIDTLARRPVAEQPEEAWRHLADLAKSCGDHERQRQCLRALYACRATSPDRASYRAWDDAMLAAQLGKTHAAAGETEAARSCAEAAMRALSTAAADQDVDRNDWLNLGDFVIPYAPDIFATLAAQVRTLLPANLAQPLRRSVEVRLARLESQSLYGQGNIEAALTKSRQGRFGLTEDEDDAYSAEVLDWLLAAGRNAEAAALAFESTLHERNFSAGHACETAARQIEAGATDAHWPLALAFAAATEDYQWVAEGEDVETFCNRQLGLARTWAPEHPALELFQAMRLMDTRMYAEALPMLERAARHTELSNPDTVRAIWLCRFHLHGVEKALSLPLIECAAAGWCYNMGVNLDHDEISSELPEGTPWPAEAVADLAARYYELGKKKFESFFASGEGMMRDADVHAYSMLCNNLAIYYRNVKKNYDIALALHLRGIAASPFAEHYDGVMWCHRRADRQEEFVASADRLWHFVTEHGYSRHNPTYYMQSLTGALHKLDRGSEVAIWLQRLEDWWAGLDDDDRAEFYEDYLGSVSSGLCNLATARPEDALARLDPILPEIRAHGRAGQLRVCGLALIYSGQKERGLALLREASMAGDPNDDWDQEQRKYALTDLANHSGSSGGKRPWWKVW